MQIIDTGDQAEVEAFVANVFNVRLFNYVVNYRFSNLITDS